MSANKRQYYYRGIARNDSSIKDTLEILLTMADKKIGLLGLEPRTNGL